MSEEIYAMFHPEQFEGCDFLARVSMDELEMALDILWEQLKIHRNSPVLYKAHLMVFSELSDRYCND